jgi:acyl-CoA reductase-like NAD-dependent aldehyde dehydrogenase
MSTASVAGVEVDTRHWIGGRRVASADAGTFTDLSPIDEQPVAEIARGGAAEVAAAVEAAGRAFTPWAATPPERRAGILDATLFTGNRARAERVSSRLVAGTVWVNCFFVRDLRAPFGGTGLSGIGREGGTWSFDFYADVKNTVFAPEGCAGDG